MPLNRNVSASGDPTISMQWLSMFLSNILFPINRGLGLTNKIKELEVWSRMVTVQLDGLRVKDPIGESQITSRRTRKAHQLENPQTRSPMYTPDTASATFKR